MPVFKDFGENGELLQTRVEPLNEGNLEQYIKENGIEKAQGYLDALEDMAKELDDCLVNRRYPGTPDGEIILYNSKIVIRRKTTQLQEQKLAFLQLAKSVIEKIKQENGPDQNANLQPT